MTCAQFRGGQKKATNRVDRSLRHQDCLRARDEVFEDRIHQLIIQTAIDKRGDLEQQLLKNKRLPYGTMPNIIRKLAEARITTNRLTLTSTFPNDFTVDNWIEYIEENYERLFNLHGSTPPPTKSQTASNWYEDITVVQHPMNRLLSKELGEDEKAAFKDLLRSRAVDITDTIATVALAGRMHVINYARYGFTQQPQQPRPQSSQSQQQPQPSRPRRSSRSQQSQPNPSQPVPPQVSHSQHISIKKICPRSPARITTHLLDSDRIPVIPPHPRLQQMMEDDDDIKQYLDFHHLSFILNNINKRSKAKHDTWHTCLNAIELKPSFIMHGHSHLKATAVRKLSTNISNMWRKSKLYWDVLRHLSRLLIRLHLAPIREQKRYNRMSGAKDEEHAAMIDSKMDIEEDYEDQIDNTNHDEEKDISNKRVLTLSSILRKLIHESDQENSMKKIVKRNQLTSREQTVINHLVNVLRPYAAIKTDHPAYTIPMVVLGIHVLTAYGYNKFVKSVFPIITPATIHSVDLDERTLYEITAERFVIPLNDQSIMTNSIDAEDHPDLIFHAFFDDGFIKQHVRRNQQFDHRIIFIPGSDMMGIQYIERREKSPMQQMASTTAATNGYDIDAFSSTITWDDDSGPSQLKDLQKKKAKQQKHMRELTKAIKDAKSNHRTVSQGDHDSILDVEMLPNDERDNIQGIDEVCHEISALSIVGDTPDTEMSCREEQDTIFKLKQTRSALYECIAKATDDISTLNTAKFAASLEKRKKKKDVKVIDRLVLNKENYRGVATSRQLDLRQLAKGADTISFAGTDRGVVQMAVSVPVSMERVLNHVNVFNDDIGDTTLDTIKLPETFTVTAKGLDNDCGTTAHMKMMQKLKKGNMAVARCEGSIKTSNPLKKDDIDSYGRVYTETKQDLRAFYYSKRIRRANRWKLYRTRRGYDRMASKERAFMKGGDKKKVVVHCIGSAGTGVGARIKKHRRRGGKIFERLHGRHTTVAITDEFRTTKLCIYCYQPCVYPMQSKKRNGKNVKARSLGSVICVNPRCLSKVHKYTTRSRDTQAAMAIALVGATEMLHNQAIQQRLPPYRRQSSSSEEYRIVSF